MRRSTLVCTALVVATTAAHAQQKGVLEIGAFANVAYFDNSLRIDQPKAGPGARLGYFFTDHVAVEGEGTWVKVDGANGIKVDYVPLRIGLAYNVGGSKGLGALIGAGYTHTMYKVTDADDVSDDGPYGKIGFRLGTGDVVSIRVDTYADWVPSPANDVPEGHAGYNLNWGIEAGLAFMPGYHGAANRDSDKDGVVDGADQCKDTPAGDKVDAKGCTLKDSDGDGVLDDTDACADTPAGDKVDAKGCSLPKDADADGVIDDKDQCKDTPAGDKVDEKGCSLPKDADGDGVTDDKDACANTPAGEKVNEKGCPLDTDADGGDRLRRPLPQHAAGDRGRCRGLPGPVRGDQEDADPRGGELRDRQGRAHAGIPDHPQRGRRVPGGQRQHQGRGGRPHRQHRQRVGECPPVEAAGRGRAAVPDRARRSRRPAHRQRLRPLQADRLQQDGGRPGAEPAGGADPDQLGSGHPATSKAGGPFRASRLWCVYPRRRWPPAGRRCAPGTPPGTSG